MLNSWTPPKQNDFKQKKPLYSKIVEISPTGLVRIGFSSLIQTPKPFQNLIEAKKANNYTEIIHQIL